MNLKPGDAVRWCAQEAHVGGREIVLDAIIVQCSDKQLLIRARNVDGSLLFRWISQRQLREVQHAEG